MAKIYVGQEDLTIKLSTGKDCSGASTLRIYYKKPSGSTGYWDATLNGEDNTYIEKVGFASTDIDEYGPWTFQSYKEEAGLYIKGEDVAYYIYADETS